MSELVGTEKSFGKLGRDAGIIGRGFRLIAGGATVGYVVVYSAHVPSITGLTELTLYFAATLAAYTAATYLLGQRLLAISNAWLRTAILLGPLAVIFALQLGPDVFHQAILLYIGISLIFSFFMRYGGCEVMSIPSLLFGTRHTVYCPLNVVDVVEKAVVDRKYTDKAHANHLTGGDMRP